MDLAEMFINLVLKADVSNAESVKSTLQEIAQAAEST